MQDCVIVAHGSPSDPAPQQAAVTALAARVAALLPGWRIRCATLASPGALAEALEGLETPAIYPFFMAEGWFTRRELPRRLAELGHQGKQLRPFGLDPDLPDLIARIVIGAAEEAGIEPDSSDLILAAHGSAVARRSKDSAYAMAETLRRRTLFWRVRVGLIEEPPYLRDIAETACVGLCLPFFALRAGHVTGDIPEALSAAGFRGPLLAAVGEHPASASLIAAAIARG